MSLALPSFAETYQNTVWKLYEKFDNFSYDEGYQIVVPHLINLPVTITCCQNLPSVTESRHMKRQRTESGNHEELCVEQISTLDSLVPAKKARKSCFVVKGKEMKAFFGLIADELIQDFLEMDSCMKIADNYIIAMVFAYFKRAGFSLREYSRTNFFIALYLANDVEEDEEEIKYEIFPWALGKKWKKKYPGFLAKRDKLLKRIDYRAIVSRRCCEEIMGIERHHSVWSRERPEHHGGAFRNYFEDSEDTYPRGPDQTPRHCSLCDPDDSQYDSASPSGYSWYISSSESTPETMSSVSNARFDMKGLKKTLPLQETQDVWPTTEE